MIQWEGISPSGMTRLILRARLSHLIASFLISRPWRSLPQGCSSWKHSQAQTYFMSSQAALLVDWTPLVIIETYPWVSRQTLPAALVFRQRQPSVYLSPMQGVSLIFSERARKLDGICRSLSALRNVNNVIVLRPVHGIDSKEIITVQGWNVYLII